METSIKCGSRLASSALALSLTVVAGLSACGSAFAQLGSGGIDIAQHPLFTQVGEAPLNMLVMGKDHKIYYEAYNDASDLNGDGALDIGYKPDVIDYYGNFNSFVCYTWSADKFVPSNATTNKKCAGKWSGDFLNYLTTSRLDALRRVLYGGWRQVDDVSETVLQGAYFPQDGHSWGKEYQGITRDGYNISQYSPLAVPPAGTYHLFAVTTLKGNSNAYPTYQAPVLRVLQNTDKRVWNWLSIEGPVAGNKCFTSTNSRVNCVTTGGTTPHPGHPGNEAAFSAMETDYAIAAKRFGSGTLSTVNCNNSNCNPFGSNDNYLAIIAGVIRVNSKDWYQFRVDGKDAVDFQIARNGITEATAGCYGARGFGPCAGGEITGVTRLDKNRDYDFKIRQETATGTDGYKLEWRECNNSNVSSCDANFTVVPSNSSHGIKSGVIATYALTTALPPATMSDFSVRVQVCPNSDPTLRESSCKVYPNGNYKPTGILHDYGEDSSMLFGLITGSQADNLEGGVLRRNIGSFGSEINAATGQFLTTVNGIANTISGFRMIGGNYNSGTDNTNADSNWNWANGTGSCPSQGNSALANGQCRMWGNPLAEMLYESMRYYAGAAKTPRFDSGTSTGNGEEVTMNLKKEAWKNPYAPVANGGLGFPVCARPFQTIISDINPSYDGDLPGSAFTGAITSTGATPSTISGFNAASEGQAIWNAEFGGGSKSVFIGDVNNVTDGAPTAKTASSFGNIRGLSPEEPSKGGTYYTASVARFARVNDINGAAGPQKIATYAIALASPLPRIDFPVGLGKITLLPFAKTSSGTFGTGVRKPTNTIVDFYVESIANLPNQPFDATINGGRPFAAFRINYEDVEQGNDHDMDAIVRYLISANVDGTVTVTLNSEYAAGSADQNMGYVMSGSTQDGVYLDVRDTDSSQGSFLPYAFNTPNPLLPGACGATTPPARCATQLPLTSTRTFTPAEPGQAGSAIVLNDPLWYAAKYGAPLPGSNDADGDGVPDNYFLVTNPSTLRNQLDKAFQDIIANSLPSASVATSAPRYVPGATLAYEVSYNSSDWTGDLRAFQLTTEGTYANALPIWSASAKQPAFGSRNIYTGERPGATLNGVPFTTAGMSATTKAALQGSLNPAVYAPDKLLDYLRGDKSKEVGQTGCTPTTCVYRKRSLKIGDILNSTPAVIGVSSFGYSLLPPSIAGAGAISSYETYVESKKTVFGAKNTQPVVYFGANDGMMHAIDGREGAGGGNELFAYVPRSIIGSMSKLAEPNYAHRYLVDGTPTVADAYFGGSWKSVLVASVGAGGKGIFALNVTNPRAFNSTSVMWEFDNSVDSDMGQFVGRPSVGLTENGKWVAVFGNGYNSQNHRAVLFIRDLSTGEQIAKLDTGVGCATTTPGCTAGPNGLATATLVDNTGDGVGETIYAGDYLGNMWRFEYVNNAWRIGNGGQPIFVAKDGNNVDAKRQSITSGVYSVAHPLGGTMLVFGTGRYLNTDDANDATLGLGTRPLVDTIYGVWDATRVYDPVAGAFTTTATDSNNAPVDLIALMNLSAGRDALQSQKFLSYSPLADDGTGGYRTSTRNPVEFRTPDFPGSLASPRYMGWYVDLKFMAGANNTGSNLLAGERVTATPQGILTDVVINTFRPSGNSCQPGAQNATLVFDALSGAASFNPIKPAGGWPGGQPPPAGGIAGTDTGIVPPAGEPPIIVVRPPVPVVPCLPDDPDCTNPPVVNDIKSCSWRSPNAAGRPAGKLIPCGRISWKQLR